MLATPYSKKLILLAEKGFIKIGIKKNYKNLNGGVELFVLIVRNGDFWLLKVNVRIRPQ